MEKYTLVSLVVLGSWACCDDGSDLAPCHSRGGCVCGPADPICEVSADGDFRIDIAVAGDISPEIRSILTNASVVAASRWERHLGDDQPAVDFGGAYPAIPEGKCFSGSPEISSPVDDILMLVRIADLDGEGGVQGTASHCVGRLDGSHVAVVGVVSVDSADWPALIESGSLVGLITHEIGHLLGLFGAATAMDMVDRTLGGGIAYFKGENAQAAYESVGGIGPVPFQSMENLHWNEMALGDEVMTARLNRIPDGSQLSVVTLSAMIDLGWKKVNLDGADLLLVDPEKARAISPEGFRELMDDGPVTGQPITYR